MKKTALLITWILIAILLVILNLNLLEYSPSENYLENQRIRVIGNVTSETNYENYKKIKLNNSIEFYCNLPCPKTLNNYVEILAIKTNFPTDPSFQIISIKFINQNN